MVFERTTLKPKLNFVKSYEKGLGHLFKIHVTVKEDSLLVYVLKFFGNLAGRCGSAVVSKGN